MIDGLARPSEGEVRMRASFPVSPAKTWSALTERARVADWLGVLEGDLRDPAGFLLRHDATTVSHHRVVDWDDGRVMELTWEFPAEPLSLIAFEVAPDDSGTMLTLVHRGLTDPVAYAAGWHRHLEYLEAHLTGGRLDPGEFWSGHEALVERYQPR